MKSICETGEPMPPGDSSWRRENRNTSETQSCATVSGMEWSGQSRKKSSVFIRDFILLRLN